MPATRLNRLPNAIFGQANKAADSATGDRQRGAANAPDNTYNRKRL
jgi:hypothetical protein